MKSINGIYKNVIPQCRTYTDLWRYTKSSQYQPGNKIIYLQRLGFVDSLIDVHWLVKIQIGEVTK